MASLNEIMGFLGTEDSRGSINHDLSLTFVSLVVVVGSHVVEYRVQKVSSLHHCVSEGSEISTELINFFLLRRSLITAKVLTAANGGGS